MYYLFTNGPVMDNFLQAFCWMLLHSVWQGLFFTILTGFMLIITKKSSASLRYTIIAGLFVSFLATCIFTFLRQWTTGENMAVHSFIGSRYFLTRLLPPNGMSQWVEVVAAFLTGQAPLIVLGWFFIFSYKCIKMTGAILRHDRIRKQGIQTPTPYWVNRLATFSTQLHITRKVRLLESAIARVPVVVGHLKPMILIPLGLLSRLPAEQVEAILLHELAHIRRGDYLINLLQYFAETLFFFNPGLLWLSSLLREERENCCDDIALSQTKNKKQFVEALVSFKEHQLRVSAMVPGFPGKRNQLLQRVTRILLNKNKTLDGSEKIFFTASLIALFTIFVTVSHYPVKIMAITSSNKKHALTPPVQAYPVTTAVAATSVTPFLPTAKNKKIVSPVPGKNRKEVRFEYYSKKIVMDTREAFAEDKQRAEQEELLAIAGKDQPDELKMQGDMDREQALTDMKQIEMDHEQILKEREQQHADRQMAEIDQVMAGKKNRTVVPIKIKQSTLKREIK